MKITNKGLIIIYRTSGREGLIKLLDADKTIPDEIRAFAKEELQSLPEDQVPVWYAGFTMGIVKAIQIVSPEKYAEAAVKLGI